MRFLTLEDSVLPVQKTVLPNGFTIITAETGSAFVDIRIVVRAGYYHDGVSGRGHFLEHLLSEGPARRHGGHPLMRPFIVSGIEEGASVGLEVATYSAKCRAEQAADVASALMRIVTELEIDPRSFEEERRVIVAELDGDWGSEEYLRWEGAARYPDDRWLHHTAGGTPDMVREITIDSIQQLHRDLYHAPNMAAVIAGGITHQEAVDHFAGMTIPEGGEIVGAVPSARLAFGQYERSIPGHDPRQLYSIPRPHDQAEARALELALDLLTNFTFGPLYAKMRRHDQLLYGLGNRVPDRLYGTMSLRFASAARNFERIEEMFVQTIQEFLTGDWRPELWPTVRNHGKNTVMAVREALQGPASYGMYASRLADQWTDDQWERIDELWFLEHVTKEQVLDVTRRYLIPGQWCRLRIT